MSKNVFFTPSLVDRKTREKKMNQKGVVLWFTGLSGSGKSTVAKKVEEKLIELEHFSYILDGDNVRCGLNSDLGFTKEDRVENLRRIGHIATLFADAGFITIAAFISPYREDRNKARELLEKDRFIEVFINATIEECEKRDPKGLYKKARNKEILNFTGIDAPYEAPINPEIELKTGTIAVDQAVEIIIDYLRKEEII